MQRLFARFEQRGDDGIAPDYHLCGTNQVAQTDANLVEEICETRREHARWGAEMIRLDLQESHAHVPCSRTVRRHLRKAGLNPAPAGRTAVAKTEQVPRAEYPHQAWQTDASEDLHLKGNKRACWLRVVDECSGAFLKTIVFAASRWEHVERHRIQEELRQVFGVWGLPGRLRTDNGYPWGSTGEFPPEMALWLIGLGIEMIWIWPGCPQQNGVVERAQETGQNWAEPQKCRTVGELQRRCDTMDQRQRERYPYRHRRSRLEVYPELQHSGRKYSRRWERRNWDLSKVLEVVSQQVVARQVDCSGSVSVYHRTRYVGKPYIGTRVYVSLDPTGPTWVFSDTDGNELRTHAADDLTAERIQSLSVLCRKGKRAKSKET